MQHTAYKDKVQDEFVARRYKGRPANNHLQLRCKVAQDLLAEESQEVKDQIKAEAAEEYRDLLEEHEDDMEGTPSLKEEDQAL
jgi:N-formylglutamate amidohydrolase